MDALGEALVRGDRRAELVGEAGLPAGIRDPATHCRVNAADQLVHVEARDIIDGGGEHLEPRRSQILGVASLALLVRAARIGQCCAQPVLKEITQRPRPVGIV